MAAGGTRYVPISELSRLRGHDGLLSRFDGVRSGVYERGDQDLAPVSADLVAIGYSLMVEQKVGQMPLRCLAERLLLFGRVNAVQPDLLLLMSGIQDGDGVSVRDAHDAALNGDGLCCADHEHQGNCSEPPKFNRPRKWQN